MLLAGIVDGDGPYALGVARVNSAADAEKWVQRYHDAGFQQMKIYSSVTSDNLKAICADAHKVGMTVTGHVPGQMTAFQAVDDGMDQINHIQFIAALFRPKDFDPDKATRAERLNAMATVDMNSETVRHAVRFFKKHRTVIDPTMALMEQEFRPAGLPAAKIEPGISKVAPELQEQLTSGGMPADVAPLGQKIVNKYLEIIGALHKAGIPIVAGTDQAVPGYSLYRELELYVESGFTPLQALQSATIVPARVMKVDRDSGSLAVGKRADFDILDANPLDDIHNIRSVHRVVSNGVLYDSSTLWEAVGFMP
jgi:imidazolonepropionase-like amidohydrolase